MKLFASVLVLLAFTINAAAQNFNKGTVSAHTHFGIEIYNTKYTQQSEINGVKRDTLTTDKAANRNFAFGGEYAVINRLTVGFRVKLNNYYSSMDSTTGATPTAKSQDYMLLANYHLVDKKVFDLSAGLGAGFSHLYYNDNWKTASNNNEGNFVKGNGPYFQFHLSPGFMIKNRVGLGMSLYSPIVNYSKMTSNNSLLDALVISKWKGSGFGFSFNLNVILVKGE